MVLEAPSLESVDDHVADRVRQPDPAPPTSRRPTGTRRRVRQAAVVVGVALLAGSVGVVAGTRIKSPADAANDRAAPTPSLITVPVERRTLVSNLIVTGEIEYVEPTPIRLAGNVGASGGDRQVITRLPEVGTVVEPGAVLLEVSGRPVFALQGALPMYRQLAPGSSGPDVLQLETALAAIGFNPGTVDALYDTGTEAAVDAFYQSRGFASEGPSDAQRTALTEARRAVTTESDRLRSAQAELARGSTATSESELLAQQQALESANAGVPAARSAAERDNADQARAVATAQAVLANAVADRDNAAATLAVAGAAGALDPETGEPYSPAVLLDMQDEVIAAEATVLEQQLALDEALAQQRRIADAGAAAIATAEDQLELARVKATELRQPADNSTQTAAVTSAEASLAEATAALAAIDAEVGTIVPAGEIVFIPVLPSTITSLTGQVGAQPSADALAQVSGTEIQIVGRAAEVDARLLVAGTPVAIDVGDAGVTTSGVIAEIRTPVATAPSTDGDADDDSSRATNDAGRDLMQVVVTPDDASRLRDAIGYTARIDVEISSTDGDVLAVPVAAVSVGPDGASRVEVLRRAATERTEAETQLVEVTVGFTAQGYAEVTPIDGGALAEGDRVAVGTRDDGADNDSDGS